MRKNILLLTICMMGFSIKVYAHPGNTDSNGGHFCWTNCEQWGYQYGEYHLHNSKQNAPATNADSNSPHTYEEGYNDAYSYWYDKVYTDLEGKSSDKKWEATWTDYNQKYSKGYQDGFNKSIDLANKNFNESEYNRGVEDGKKDAENGQKNISAYDSWERSKKEPDYIRGYEDGFSEGVKQKEQAVVNEVENIEVPKKFQKMQDSFIMGYKTGFYDAKTGYNYNEKQDLDKYKKDEERKQYTLGYLNGWNDEGGSLPIFFKINLWYFNIKRNGIVAILSSIIVLIIIGYLIGKWRSKKLK